LDGARAGLHDGSRGVPGSWRRAVEGIDRLLGAGVGVCVVHVVTPGNAGAVPDFLEQMWALGVPWVRVTPVVVSGAAARGGDWDVSRDALRRVAAEFEERRGQAMRITVQAGTGGTLSLQGRAAPGSFLVRPNGDVRPDSLRPFTFGNAVGDGVEACWAALREGWDDERINAWAGTMKRPEDLPKSELVPYLDDEIPIVDGSSTPTGARSARSAKLPKPTPLPPADPELELREAQEKVRELAAARRYRHALLRWSGSPGQRFVRLVGDGGYLRLNESASAVMDALDGGTLGDAAAVLANRYGLDPERAREDAIAATRDLVRRRVVLAASATGFFPAESGTSDLPGLEPSG
ncbi:MAG: PqqD family peptide modification chaperone, partial [Solirubrobacterales bacterium]